MVSDIHEVLLKLLREEPRIVTNHLRQALDIRLPSEPPAIVEATLNQITPTEYRADLVLKLGASVGIEILGYRVLRDDEEAAELGADETTWRDRRAEPAIVEPPSALIASMGTRSDGVELSWTPATVRDGPRHSYRIEALTAEGATEPSMVAFGARLAPSSIRYELRRDGGSWINAEEEARHLDVDAPMGLIAAAAKVIPDGIQSFVELGLVGEPEIVGAEPSLYELRVVGVGFDERLLEAIGWRAAGEQLEIQWQRAAPGEALVDLEGATSQTWLDLDGNGEELTYRAILRTVVSPRSQDRGAGGNGFG